MAIQGDGITWGVLLGVLGSYVLSVLASLTAPVWRSAGLSGFRYAAAVRIFYYADRYVRMRAWLARPPLMVVEFVYANFRLTVAVIAILALLAAPVLFPGSSSPTLRSIWPFLQDWSSWLRRRAGRQF
jgi:hypothetical protein